MKKMIKQMTPNDFEQMYLSYKDTGTDKQTRDFWAKRVNERIEYIKPLIKECLDKGIDLSCLSRELHQEWIELLMVKDYYNI
jgi:hypothetical protein